MRFAEIQTSACETSGEVVLIVTVKEAKVLSDALEIACGAKTRRRDFPKLKREFDSCVPIF